MITEEAVLAALRTVDDPELHRDLVSLGMIKKLRVEGADVSFEVELTTPACPLRARIEQECRAALGRIPGIGQVRLGFGARVAASRGMGTPKGIPGVKHAIAVASGKGGVGKSTVSVNLAVALAQTGAAVGLLDADIYGPSIPVMMGIQEQPTMGPDRRVIPPTAHGVKLMSLGFLLPDTDTPVIWRGPMVGKALTQFLREVNWGELDYLLIDLPPGTGDAQLTLSQELAMSGAVIVTTPQDVAMRIASRVLVMFRKMGVPILGIVENMSGFLCPACHRQTPIFSQGGGEQASREMGVPLLGQIPLDGEVCEGGDDGKPILLRNPASPVADIFRRLAGGLAARASVEALSPAPTGSPSPFVILD